MVSSKKKITNIIKVTMLVIMLTMVSVFTGMLTQKPSYAAAISSDASVENTASMSTDTIYQIVTDRFFDGDPSINPQGEIFDKNNLRKYHGGDWAGITAKLNDGYLTNMGISALWISAPVENITTIDPSNGSAAYHGYWARDFFKSNAYFGSIANFQTMVNTAHAKNIKVVIDFAPNHTSTAELGTMQFPEDGRLYRDGQLVSGFTTDTQGIFNHLGWTDFETYENGIYHSMFGLADLNHRNNTVDKYLKESINKWLALGVDGIRVDAVKHMSQGFQTNWMSSVYTEKPVFTFGEWYAGGTGSEPDMERFANTSGMSVLDFRFANSVRNAVGDLSMNMQQLHATIAATEADFQEVNDQVTFIDNHDMPRFATLANNNRRSVENAYVLMLTSRGVPTVYYGSEQYAQGGNDPENRGDMPGFSQSSTAYKVISKLAPLRKTNPALAYGTTTEKWLNNDVYVYERKFGNSIVLTAVNRNQSTGYQLSGLTSSLPNGTYNDVMGGLLGGGNITMTNGAASAYFLNAGQSVVWQYTATNETTPTIGNVDPMIGIVGNTVTITGRGFGSTAGNVKFGTTNATIVSWADSIIQVKIPAVTAGEYGIKVTRSNGVASNVYAGFNVLSGKQTTVRFKINNVTTAWGENLYLVGNAPELGSWNADKAIGPFFNATPGIAEYPDWFYDINVPAGYNLEFKFIKKNAAGVVIWEGGNNHTYSSPANSTGEITVNWQ